jgi:hypothetical protein
MITFQVMAVAQVSPHDHDAVDAFIQGMDYQVGVHHPGAVHPDDPQVGGILHAGDARQVRTGISAPVTEEAKDYWFEIV